MNMIPASWLPDATVKRIIPHWTGGGYFPSETDREHYHFLIEGDGDYVRGEFPVTANHPPLREGRYAAHTRNTNSYAIGVAMCCMAGAVQNPFNPGRSPMTQVQWDRMVMLVALLCRRYNVAVTPQSVLTHAEVQTTLGIRQNGKWDVATLPFDRSLKDAFQIGARLRNQVKGLLK